ncbi:MAG: aldehyde dehydrogenase family protein [Deltaproteobacteria bacterium]|nr:aldehyde dehydrogenase family protein [Deltaproteobacteria bacterium]
MAVIDVTNPSNGEKIGQVEAFTQKRAIEALARARAAQARWDAGGLDARARVLLRFRDILLDRADEVCELLSRENGKVLQESLEMEVFPIADLVTYFAGKAREILDTRPIPLHLLMYRRSYLHYRPRGVVFVIGPWNFPFTIPFGSVLMALLAGNAVLLKPASLTPLIAMKGRELFDEAGLDPDLFQVLPCSGKIASGLIDKGVDYVNFTGSTPTGRLVASKCGKALVPCSMELGGKDPAIVLPDANIDLVVPSLVWGAFANAGQVCASVERAYVHEQVYDEVVSRVVERTRRLDVGNPLEDGTDMGPMTDPVQLAIVERHVEDAVKAGASVLCGGSRIEGPGNYFEPTVLVDVDETMSCLSEETFGPTLPIVKVSSVDEAIRRANDSDFGLNAYVFTSSRSEGRRVAERIDAGGVLVNEVLITHACPETPWGGVKTSGIGRVHGDDGLREMCEVYHVNEEKVRLPVAWSPFWQPYSHDMYRRILAAARTLQRSGLRGRADALRSLFTG